jgi:glycine/D-amino acid oxidase-like deaminating enzyme/nitrite reductase/ring-hydroxylating ferredoxin subunit
MAKATGSFWSETAPAPAVFAPLARDLDSDVVVVGGGITGLTVAALLAETGRRVALVERNRLGSGTTGRTTAHLTAALDIDFATLIGRFGEEAARSVVASVTRAIDEIERGAAGAPGGCGFRRVPGFRFSEDTRVMNRLDEEVELARKLRLDAELVADVPLPFRCPAALRLERQAVFQPLAYLDTLAKRVVHAGGEIFEHSPVVEITESGVRLANGPCIRAESVIEATHTPVGLVVSIQTRVSAWTSYVLAVRLERPLEQGLYWDCGDPYHYVRAADDEGSLILVGGEDHRTGREPDPHARFAALEAWTRKRFPVRAIERRWSHELFEPADGLPYVGALPGSSSHFVAAGFSGTGLTFGTVAALLLHELVTLGSSPWESLYTPTRLRARSAALPMAEENLRIGWRFVADRLRRGQREHADLARDSGRVERIEGEQIAVYRDPRGELHYLSPRCPHLGCIVAWNDAEKTWDCPCHGGRFQCTGKVLYGPPTADLAHEDAAADEAAERPRPAARAASARGF